MRCLVTGATGFIGLRLCERLLADGHEICGIDAFIDYYPGRIKERNLSIARSWERFTFIESDLLSLPLLTLLDGVDWVFHQAAQAGFTFISDVIDTNIQATASEKAAGEVVNIAGGSRVSLHEVMQILRDVSGMPVHVLYQGKQHGDMDHIYADTSRACEVLGYNPRVSLCEGLAREFTDIADLYGYSKNTQITVA